MEQNCDIEETTEDIYLLAEQKIQFGENLRRFIDQHGKIDGLQKLSRKINQELKFLGKVYKSRNLKKEHLQCSNLTHFSALVDTLKTVDNCHSVNKIFTLYNRKTTVDIICDNGLTWMKVIARNPKSLSQIYMGNASYGVRSIVDQAEEYIECAKLHPCLFQTPKGWFDSNNLVLNVEKTQLLRFSYQRDWSPTQFVCGDGIPLNTTRSANFLGVKVDSRLDWSDHIDCLAGQISRHCYALRVLAREIVFVFTNGIGNNLATKLEKLGIIVKGNRTSVHDIIEESDSEASEDEHSIPTTLINNYNEPLELSTKNIDNIKKVNLDVSAMLAYCCSVANGSAFLYDFDVPVLKQQAEWERQRPVKPILDNFFKGKQLYCCETAKESFENIVNTVGGPTEKNRAEELMKRVIILPDNATFKDTKEGSEGSEIFHQAQFTKGKILDLGGKIRQRSLTVFMFGDQIQAITVTSNDGFVRAAKQQNINFVVFVHESRALTEQKELIQAKPLNLEENKSTS
ncbi:unnamed protein product [Ceutorhynchus assimilis]|uniref:DUF1308 domain-containing protein n=1 Tax=Ceutorhynchus assimilis TaxID=467358 RepID=A0A9N9ME62_9CUCU|nr:unnamed protein product [Ceutorhynchus assimilis]